MLALGSLLQKRMGRVCPSAEARCLTSTNGLRNRGPVTCPNGLSGVAELGKKKKMQFPAVLATPDPFKFTHPIYQL